MNKLAIIFYAKCISLIYCHNITKKLDHKIYIGNSRNSLGGKVFSDHLHDSKFRNVYFENANAEDVIGNIFVPESPYFRDDYHKNTLKKDFFDTYGSVIRNKRSAPKRAKKPKKPKIKIHHHNHKRSHRNKKRKRRLRRGKKRNKRDTPGKRVRRLIGANDGKIEEFPYVVSIQYNNEHWCSGALLNQRLVISTANCFWKSNRESTMLVRAGSRFTNKGGQLAKIDDVIRHPDWSTRSNPHSDVALALLDRLLQFSDTLHAVDLPNRGMEPYFKDFWVASYGAIRRDGIYVPEQNSLQVYYAKMMDKKQCNNITRRYGVLVDDDFICLTQFYRRAPCTRDTGAPAVSDGILWGLASWGIRKICGNERFPAMFSFLSSESNANFIVNATTILQSEKRSRPFYEAFNPSAKESWDYNKRSVNVPVI